MSKIKFDMMKPNIPYCQRFIIYCLFFISFLCILASINRIQSDSLLRFGRCAVSLTPHDDTFAQNYTAARNSSSMDEIRILIGVLTLPDQYHKRHLMRLVYGTQSPENAKVDVKFVFCNLTTEEQKLLVALEIMRFDDIIILNCKENMNQGKTYTYFSSLPEMLNDTNGPFPRYHYVMKADDDTYFRLDNFVESLRPLPREDLYYGRVVPCGSMNPFRNLMSGMGYLVSWDIVEWIKESDIPLNHKEGPEDRVFEDWLRTGQRGQNRFNSNRKWSMYDFPEIPTACTHELWPGTIAVHLLKTQERWIKTLNYFNVTKDLKPSKLYHIP